MIDINLWLDNFFSKLNETFGKRTWFVGLQGSFGRGEATESSDIDVVVILDELSATDVQAYNTMLNGLDHRELICGFISGKEEIFNWEPSDLFQFYHDTIPIEGSLDELLSLIDETAVNRAIKIGICNIYHGCVHNMLHDKSDDLLRALYKSASFVLQAIAYKQTGRYIRRQSDLTQALPPQEKAIAETFINLKNGNMCDFEKFSQMLFTWSKKWIAQIK